jgi:MFS family permease
MSRSNPARAWLTLACVSLMFFLITAATFTSLGVVLPSMVEELHWSWGAAGSGFSLLAVLCGVTSTIPASMIRRFGVRVTLAAGAMVMAVAFSALAATHGLAQYLIGCSLAGLGFTLLATVPGTYLLARLFARPSLAFGLYFTVGGLGGVAGPLVFFWVEAVGGGWRDYWLVSGAAVTLVGVVSAFLVDTATDVATGLDGDPGITRESWRVRDAMKTPQFVIIAATYSIFLFVGVTVNAVSVTHLNGYGISTGIAGGMISVEQFLNAGARFLGGAATRFIDPRKLLMLSLSALIVGLLALCVAHSLPLLLVYAAGIGIGYGLTFFASTILLLDYFGRAPNLELFSAVNLISTVGAVGPAFAGFVEDRSGSFVPAFLALAGLTLLVLLAVALMRAPHRQSGTVA